MANSAQQIEAVRRFNRFYTAAIGTLDEGLLKSSLSLAEARLLFEISTCERPIASEIAGHLKLDLGYVSRILRKFEDCGLIRRKTSSVDARQNIISLTAAGLRQFAALDKRSNTQVAAMLASLSTEKRQNLLEAMKTIESALGAENDQIRGAKPFMLRNHRPGDMGWIVHRHGALYAQEYGWDDRFEALVARIAADFIDQYDPASERCWIAERDSEFLGCVFLVKDRTSDQTAKLRLLLVEPKSRGLGVGRALVRQCTQFGRQAGYARIVLWTQSILNPARHIYQSEGYRLMKEEHHESFGKKLTGEYWELQL
ncbi:MAG TPA: helix-turn-helix domain-containing GNAT family N-acetyltransferase [Bryobacteraceae bacterium]|nr:helix-turn-helix domain-containing GNAT family N-acetyltransferase [Bryobacteraceae bacterium]